MNCPEEHAMLQRLRNTERMEDDVKDEDGVDAEAEFHRPCGETLLCNATAEADRDSDAEGEAGGQPDFRSRALPVRVKADCHD